MNTTIESTHSDTIALVEQRLECDAWKGIEAFEGLVEKDFSDQCERLPLNHIFTPGIYVRQCFMRKGLIVTTRIHLTEHPFNVLFGAVSVREDDKWVTYRSGHTGVTKPGTRRILVVQEDCVWQTIHANPTNEKDPDKIVQDVTYCGGKYADLRGASTTEQERLLT